jgi:hypothetical protein
VWLPAGLLNSWSIVANQCGASTAILSIALWVNTRPSQSRNWTSSNSEGILQRTRYDLAIERFATDDAVFVADNGATVFLPLWTYIVETEMFTLLRQAGRLVYLHVPISGGEMLNDTLLGFKTLAEVLPKEPHSVDQWILRTGCAGR